MTNEKVNFTEKEFSFSGKGRDGNTYQVSIEFFEDVKNNETKWAVHGFSTNFVIPKKEASFWPRLTKSKVKHPWLSIDWSRWVDEDDAGKGFDLSGMNDFGGMDLGAMGDMAGMGGMGDMGGMGGDEE
uniref:CS domain-containing protein n=1 Tax=Arcella intermedia TaxID=1963864 RepID=A0A6B2LNP5_9EUKA